MLVDEHTYIPLFGGWCEVCMLGGGRYIHTSVWGLVRLVAGLRYVC